MNRSPVKIRALRDAGLRAVVEKVLYDGHCKVYDDPRLDDEPLSPMAEAAFIFSAGLSRPPKAKTFRGELERICKERGWDLLYDVRLQGWSVTAPMALWPCKACDGKGRIGWTFLAVRLCPVCKGERQVFRRASPAWTTEDYERRAFFLSQDWNTIHRYLPNLLHCTPDEEMRAAIWWAEFENVRAGAAPPAVGGDGLRQAAEHTEPSP